MKAWSRADGQIAVLLLDEYILSLWNAARKLFELAILIGHFELTMDRTLLYPEGSKLFTMSLLSLPFSVVMGGVSKVRVFKVSGSRVWHQSLGFFITMRRFPLNWSYTSSHFFRRIIGQSYFFLKFVNI